MKAVRSCVIVKDAPRFTFIHNVTVKQDPCASRELLPRAGLNLPLHTGLCSEAC